MRIFIRPWTVTQQYSYIIYIIWEILSAAITTTISLKFSSSFLTGRYFSPIHELIQFFVAPEFRSSFVIEQYFKLQNMDVHILIMSHCAVTPVTDIVMDYCPKQRYNFQTYYLDRITTCIAYSCHAIGSIQIKTKIFISLLIAYYKNTKESAKLTFFLVQ